MATAKGIAKISGIFDRAYNRPIDGNAYSLWTEIFASIDDSDLIAAAMWLVEGRERSLMVTPGEVNWALRSLGVYMKREESPAWEAAMARQFPENVDLDTEVSLAAWRASRKANGEGGEAVQSYLKGRKDG